MKVLAAIRLVILTLLVSPFVVAEVITWEEIQSDRLDTRRSDTQQEIYLRYLERLRDSKKSPETTVLEDIFRLSSEQAEACRSGDCQLDSRLVINSFPYWLEDDVVHLLVFVANKSWKEGYLISESERLLRAKLSDLKSRYDLQWRIYVNPPHKRTVGLAHAHIFLKGVDTAEIAEAIKAVIPFSKPGLAPW
ncbi:DUF3605 domain-containing protein [Endozoicomonas arenosclerae]|uniref:DUF3605 domain-containing protein n=1 Tax=Endozoicomonas arenosclerae TaxID=1633495 RepID=UPI000B0D70BA|nr:DUF3605 domain-containing protein [Endozoicomonas arenosclerae]